MFFQRVMHVSSPIQPYLCLHLPNLPSEISQLSWPEDCAGQESPSPHHSLNLPTYLLLLRQADVSWKSSSSSAPLPWLTGPELGSVLACSCPTPSTDWDAASDYQTLPRMGMGLDKGSSHHLGDQMWDTPERAQGTCAAGLGRGEKTGKESSIPPLAAVCLCGRERERRKATESRCPGDGAGWPGRADRGRARSAPGTSLLRAVLFPLGNVL
ncbi:uncharacterized protein LOC126635764 isoform X3 [Myiozetetes cayanensis]|uniref:uncharacterized protein LOC126635764 isoform X3 n=1 Tax=Myiozetetes cayanensis TaxID=478635 RepID=UPI00215F2480|nr:uncharacterized protein LOC126635764 isoform X3 [Myiozetetes cayanensis]